jgi:hypothetical protein
MRMAFCAYSDPAGIRTQDPYIKSVMLYRLSYGIPHLTGIRPVGLLNFFHFFIRIVT